MCFHVSGIQAACHTYPGSIAILGDREGGTFPSLIPFPFLIPVAPGYPDIEKRSQGNIQLQNLPEPRFSREPTFFLYSATLKNPYKCWPSGLCRKDVEIICWIGKSIVSWVVLLGIWNISENITKFWNHSFSPCLNPRILFVQLPHFRGGKTQRQRTLAKVS